MNCLECGEEMESRIGSVPYKALPGTFLSGIRIHECPNCAEVEVEIPRITELNSLLARVLICQTTRLTGPQVRFLRKYLGLSGTDFARRMGVSKESVSRWETEKQHISPSNDRLLRLMVAYEEPIEDYAAQLANVAQEAAHSVDITVNIEESESRWQTEERLCL